MKEKWNKLATFLGLTAFVMSADGIFMSEENVDKMEAVRVKNEELTASIATLNAEHATALETITAENDSNIALLATANTSVETLTADNTRLTAELGRANVELVRLNGGPTLTAGAVADPIVNEDGKRKLTQREHALERSAAEMRGEKYTGDATVDPEEEEEEEGAEGAE